MAIRKDYIWPMTANLGLPLYRARENADLTSQYNTAMMKLDQVVSNLSSVSANSGIPSTSAKLGELYVDTDTMVMYAYVNKDGINQWMPLSDESDSFKRPSMWFHGEGAPAGTGATYQKQDFYLDTDNGNVWMFTGTPAEQLKVEIDSDNLPVLKRDDEIIAKNWFRTQGTASYVFDGTKTEFAGIPNGQIPVTLPIDVYVTPFKFTDNFGATDYDLYYHLSGSKFDSGRHFEHHLAGENEIESIAEVPVARMSAFDSCKFTILRLTGETTRSVKMVEFTTYGLYRAADYEKMQLAGVKAFDASGVTVQESPWILVANIMGKQGEKGDKGDPGDPIEAVRIKLVEDGGIAAGSGAYNDGVLDLEFRNLGSLARRGREFYSGNGAPIATGNEHDGDSYVDLTTGTFYEYGKAGN